MEWKKYLLPVGGLVAFFFLIKKAVLAQNVTFELNSIQVDGSIINPELKVNLVANNPTLETAVLSGISGKIYSDGNTYIGNIISTAVVDILPNAKTIIPITANLVTSGILETIANVINSKNANFTFIGTAIIDNILVPLNISYKVI